MPKISELPTTTELTGRETVALVQNGETRQAVLSELLNVPRTVSVSHARWMKSSDSSTFLNSPALELIASSGGC